MDYIKQKEVISSSQLIYLRYSWRNPTHQYLVCRPKLKNPHDKDLIIRELVTIFLYDIVNFPENIGELTVPCTVRESVCYTHMERVCGLLTKTRGAVFFLSIHLDNAHCLNSQHIALTICVSLLHLNFRLYWQSLCCFFANIISHI